MLKLNAVPRAWTQQVCWLNYPIADRVQMYHTSNVWNTYDVRNYCITLQTLSLIEVDQHFSYLGKKIWPLALDYRYLIFSGHSTCNSFKSLLFYQSFKYILWQHLNRRVVLKSSMLQIYFINYAKTKIDMYETFWYFICKHSDITRYLTVRCRYSRDKLAKLQVATSFVSVDRSWMHRTVRWQATV